MAENGLDWKVVEFSEGLSFEEVEGLADYLFNKLEAIKVVLESNNRRENFQNQGVTEFSALSRMTIYGNNFAVVSFNLSPKPLGSRTLYDRLSFDALRGYSQENHNKGELDLLAGVRKATGSYFVERDSQRTIWDAQEQSDRVRGID